MLTFIKSHSFFIWTLNNLHISSATITPLLACLVLGILWYSPYLFGKIWRRELQKMPNKSTTTPMLGIFFFVFLIIIVLQDTLPKKMDSVIDGMLLGFTHGIILVLEICVIHLLSLLVESRFKTSKWIIAINSSYLILCATITGGTLIYLS